MKVLIFLPGGIGDVLMATPFIRQLRKNINNAYLTCLTSFEASKVLEGNIYINEIVIFNYKDFFGKNLKEIYNLWKRLFKKYDVIFMLNKHKLFNLFSYLLGIKIKIGFDRCGEGKLLTYKVPYYGRRHEIFYYLDLLKGLNIKPDYNDYQMDVFLSGKNLDFAKKFFEKNNLKNKKVIAIAPGGAKNIGANDDIRRWPVENYIKLIKALRKKNIEVILIGGKEDIEIEKRILNEIKCLSLIAKCSLKNSAAIMRLVDIIVCNDSGPMHLAAAVNKKVISIFGPTNPIEKAPLHKESIYLWDQVGCNPCFDLWGRYPKKCPYGKKCMYKINVERVFSVLDNIIRQKS